MGTRGFIGWKIDGKITTTYNHYDSYPSGVGLDVLETLRDRINALRASELSEFPVDLVDASAVLILGAEFRTIKTFTENQKLSAKAKAALAPFTDSKVSTGDDNYALARHLQGKLGVMLDAKLALRAEKTWPKDSLFCEWGYLVNFDTEVPSLEVYQGFRQVTPAAGEWAGQNALMENKYGPWEGHSRKVIGKKRSEYFPVERIAAFPLASLPTDEEFIAGTQELVEATV